MAGCIQIIFNQSRTVMKQTSFQLSFILLTVLCITSCKDDPEPKPSLPSEMVLSKVFRDGKLEFEYRYSESKQLEQIREYELSTGLLVYFTEFQYDNRGFLEKEVGYNENEKAISSKKYLKNGSGQFLSSDFIPLVGDDSGQVTTRYKFEYNKAGYISKESWYDPETDTEKSYRSYYYYPNGNLERYEYYWSVVPAPEKAFETRYSSAGQTLPENIYKHRGYAINFWMYYFVAEKIEYEIFDSALSPAGEYHEVIGDRIYNSQGLITAQTITYKYILPAQPDEVISITFEYIEI